MNTTVSLYSSTNHEIEKFLKSFYQSEIILNDDLKWEKSFENPIEIADIIGVFIDNNYKYKINLWVTLDENFAINVRDSNANQIIKYLFERYPY